MVKIKGGKFYSGRTVFLGLFFLLILGKSFAFSEKIEESVKVRAVVGKYKLTLMGYTSPGAKVEMEMGKTVKEETIARNDGVFIFYEVWMPEEPGEICFIATDIDGISNSPLCLPAPAKKDTSIFDIYLGPTLALATDKVAYNKTKPGFGRTTPDSEVEIYLFRKEGRGNVFSAHAKEAPKVVIKSNKKGYFEFNLPSNVETSYRVFVGSRFGNFISPKSNTLTYWVIKAMVWTVIIVLILLIILIFALGWLVFKKRKNILPCIGD